MSIIEIILGSDTAYLLGYYSTWSLPKCNPGNSKIRYHTYCKKNPKKKNHCTAYLSLY